jgi:sarcosine oxidase
MTGGVDIGRATNAALLACREALDEAGFGSVWLEGAEAERAFPQFKLDEGSAVLWQSGAGILNADVCVQSLARRAAARSATIAQESRVSAVEPAGKSVVVRFEMASGESQAVEAGAVVIAAGPWVGRFAPALGVANEFRVTHQQVAYYPVEDGDLWRVGRCPVYIAHGRNGFYGFPTRERPGFIKVSIELDTAIDNPDEAPREPDATAVTRLNSLVERRLRGVVPLPAEVVTCRYTETVRRDYLIDKIPGSPNIVVASPCSGHGFKFSILTGALAAGLATSQAAPSEFPNWRPAFAIGAPEGTPRMLAPDWRDGG